MNVSILIFLISEDEVVDLKLSKFGSYPKTLINFNSKYIKQSNYLNVLN